MQRFDCIESAGEPLCCDEAEDDGRGRRDEAEGGEVAGSVIVILEQVAVELECTEESFGVRVIRLGAGEHAAVVAPTNVNRRHDVLYAIENPIVEGGHLAHCVTHMLLLLRRPGLVHHREVRCVNLQVDDPGSG